MTDADRIETEVPTKEKPVAEAIAEHFANRGTYVRQFIELKDGESRPIYDDAPEGMRSETDSEFRARILATLSQNSASPERIA